MKRETLYIIGRRKIENQQVGRKMCINLEDSENAVDEMDNKYYTVLFGKDEKGVMYMILAIEEQDSIWRNAHKSCGHWHGCGYYNFVKGYQVKLRKNFKDNNEANKYYNIVRQNMDDILTWRPSRKFTEKQIDRLFA